MSTNAQYLMALADELMHPCPDPGPDEGDKQRLYRIADAHEKLVELAKLCYDVIEDDLEERPARHSLGNLSARLRAILKEGTI